MDILIILHTVIGCFLSCRAQTINEWSYISQRSWPAFYPQCAGKAQSPINIDQKSVVYDTQAPDFNFEGYRKVPKGQLRIVNSGYSVQAEYTRNIDVRVTFKNWGRAYRVSKISMHWGATPDNGSEHTLDGKTYPMELHIHHYSTNYSSYKQAQQHKGGVMILAILIEAGVENKMFDAFFSKKIIERIRNYHGKTYVMPIPIYDLLGDLLWRNFRYFMYDGSLSHPPCLETVTWFLCVRPMYISKQQISRFKSVRRNGVGRLLNFNFRSTQKLNGRKIKTNSVRLLSTSQACGLMMSTLHVSVIVISLNLWNWAISVVL